MKLIAISGWNTPQKLIENFCAPIAKNLNIDYDVLDYQGSQLTVDQQIEKFDQLTGNEKIIIFAWSLGGNLALKWQEKNPNILCVITAATNLDFVDETFGMSKHQFDQFCQGFSTSNPKMLARMQKKFSQLVLMGASKETSAKIKADYDALNQDIGLLHHSLLWLEQINLEANQLNKMNQYWFADQDSLVPKNACKLFDNNQLFSGSHAFFLEDELKYQTIAIEHFKKVLAAENG